MIRTIGLVAMLSVMSVAAHGAIIPASSCSSTSVQNAINSASNGDTVTLPGPCSTTWSAVVSIPASKGITLDCKGASITRSSTLGNGQGAIQLQAGAVSSRITGCNFNGTDTEFQARFIGIAGDASAAKFRIDHCTFNSSSMAHIQLFDASYGLIDHNVFQWSGNNEVIQHMAYGAGSTEGWSIDVVPGSPDALYIEDNTFENSATPNYLGGKTAAFYGAKTVHRFNTMKSMVIDQHGTGGMIGARWWESYKNTFTEIGNVDRWHQIRAGTGVIWGDTAPSGGGGLVLWEEDAGYPAAYQIGRGKCGASPCSSGSNQVLSPAYIWMTDPDEKLSVAEASAGQIAANRDYYVQVGSFNGTAGIGVGPRSARPSACTPNVAYWATDEGEWWAANPGPDGRLYKCSAPNTWTLYYTPYTYPHPLTTASSTTSPESPTNLRVVP